MVHQFGIKENMYNKKDMENANVENRIPDGMSDETDFVNTLQQVTNLFKSTNYDTSQGRTVYGLELINLCCGEDGEVDVNKAVNVIIAMSSHISHLISSLKAIGLPLEKYYESYEQTLLNPLVEKPVIPYYES